jgi:hypothetical protein
VHKIHTDMAKPREVVLRGPAADQLQDGPDMRQGTRTRRQAHNEAPAAVEATICASLRAGAFLTLPRWSGRGYTSPLEGVEMT